MALLAINERAPNAGTRGRLRSNTLTNTGILAMPDPEINETTVARLVQSIQSKIDAARATRDVPRQTLQTMAKIIEAGGQ